MDLQAAKLRN